MLPNKLCIKEGKLKTLPNLDASKTVLCQKPIMSVFMYLTQQVLLDVDNKELRYIENQSQHATLAIADNYLEFITFLIFWNIILLKLAMT